MGSIEEARLAFPRWDGRQLSAYLLSVTPYGRCTPMVCASSAIKLASSVVATAPSGRAAHATDPNFRVLFRQADPMPTGPQVKDAIARSSVSNRKIMTMRLPYLRRNRAFVRHGGIDCSCCASWGWLVLGCGCDRGVHSCGSSRPRVAGVGARAAVPCVAA
jgi:hypothetical protein